MFSKNLNGLSGRAAMKFLGKDEILSACAKNGQKAVSEVLGMANPGVLSGALVDLGWREQGTPRGPRSETSERTPRARKISGCLPVKTGIAIAIVLGLSPEDGPDMCWSEWKQALEIQGEGWITLLESRLQAGKAGEQAVNDFRAWRESNQAADDAAAALAEMTAEQRAERRAKVQARLEKAVALAARLERQLAELD